MFLHCSNKTAVAHMLTTPGGEGHPAQHIAGDELSLETLSQKPGAQVKRQSVIALSHVSVSSEQIRPLVFVWTHFQRKKRPILQKKITIPFHGSILIGPT